ncbi:hypothetical protein A3Q56_05179 [Intoshia linei]|uniref:Uncharacterized protein n=1 Tax=Intoshia linei TaxID=1819745 RepID=A0A177B0C8_9BILA|nr:hypothetical protein A3Q56_05179 [Intoshia linei]
MPQLLAYWKTNGVSMCEFRMRILAKIADEAQYVLTSIKLINFCNHVKRYYAAVSREYNDKDCTLNIDTIKQSISYMVLEYTAQPKHTRNSIVTSYDQKLDIILLVAKLKFKYAELKKKVKTKRKQLRQSYYTYCSSSESPTKLVNSGEIEVAHSWTRSDVEKNIITNSTCKKNLMSELSMFLRERRLIKQRRSQNQSSESAEIFGTS